MKAKFKTEPSDSFSQSPNVFEALATLKSEEEVKVFLSDLCTPGELRAMSERWRAAQMVYDEVPYRRICELTGVSTATVTRVARALNEGTGYSSLIQKLRGKRSKPS